MDIDKFIRERKPTWTRLAELLDAFERSSEWDMGHERIKELVTLYRQACTDLNQARSYTANPELLDTLNQITGRAYRLVYSEGGRAPLRETFWRFVSVQIPQTFQKEIGYVLGALLPFVLGIVFGVVAVKIDRKYAEVIIPGMFNSMTPAEHVKRVEESYAFGVDSSLDMSSMLYTNNIKCAFLVFSLAALTYFGGIYYLFWTGTWLGAIAFIHHDDGFVRFFYGWVGPHGALELPAIVFAGAAGLRFGRALLMPGSLSRRAALQEAFGPVWKMLCTVMGMLVIAGIIEGSFSQFSTKLVSYDVKIGTAVCLFTAMIVYLFVSGRRRVGRAASPSSL